MLRQRIARFLAMPSLLLVGCDGDERAARTERPAAMAFDTTIVRIETARDTFQITAELAATAQQKAQGLMDRDSLPAGHGMLFLYPDGAGVDAGFWMFRTRIPLDIAFMDSSGRILAIERMQPCESYNPEMCRTYSPGVSYFGALEMNEGFFREHGVRVGDRIRR